MNNDAEIIKWLTLYKRIAVVGLSPDTRRPSFGVTRYMIQHGYEITGVRPGGIQKILDRPCFEKLDQVPGSLEIINVFRASEYVAQVVDEVLKLKPKVLWLQEGVSDPKQEERARESGIAVISNRCILKEHARLISHRSN